MIFIGILVVTWNAPEPEKPLMLPTPPLPAPQRDPSKIYRDCPACGWMNSYEDSGRADMGLASHKRWCKAKGGQNLSHWLNGSEFK